MRKDSIAIERYLSIGLRRCRQAWPHSEYRFCWHRSISAPIHEDTVAFQDFPEDNLHALGDDIPTLFPWLGGPWI